MCHWNNRKHYAKETTWKQAIRRIVLWHKNLYDKKNSRMSKESILFKTTGSRRVWPVSRGCLLLHGTWSCLRFFEGPCCPTLDFVCVFWTMITFNTLLLRHFISAFRLMSGSIVISDFDWGLTAGVTGQQRMLAPPWRLILPSLCRRFVLPYTRFCICFFLDYDCIWHNANFAFLYPHPPLICTGHVYLFATMEC